MSELVQHAEGLWTVSGPHRFFGLHLGTRMTVIRLPDGALWLHSVVAIDDLLADEIQAKAAQSAHRDAEPLPPRLRDRRHPAVAHGPGARTGGDAPEAAGAADRRRALRDGRTPSGAASSTPVHIDGSMLDETVFVHGPSRTLICADLVENFDTSPHLPTRLYLKAAGLEGRVGWSRFLRRVYRDRRATRRSLERVLALDFDRIVLAHGRVLEQGGPAALRDAYRWLEPAATTGG